MKKIIIILFSLSFSLGWVLCLTACNLNPKPYHFIHSLDEIQDIQIVHIELQDKDKDREFYPDMLDDCKILADIEDHSEFIERFKSDVLFTRYLFGDPTSLVNGDYAIKIDYINGDFEMIGYDAQCIGYLKTTSDGRNSYRTGFGVVNCNKNDFMNFINLYLAEPVQF